MKNKRFIKICPNCGGVNITIPKAGLDLIMTMKDYCKECLCKGNFPEVDVEDVKKIRKKLLRD
jgi:hypothetical protein